MIIGAHVPAIPLLDVDGSGEMEDPLQNGPTELNDGVTFGLMVMVKFVDVAHCPAAGVNVYDVVVMLLMEGDQEPDMLLVEIVGSAGIEAPLQKGPTGANTGATELTIVIVPVALTELQLPRT